MDLFQRSYSHLKHQSRHGIKSLFQANQRRSRKHRRQPLLRELGPQAVIEVLEDRTLLSTLTVSDVTLTEGNSGLLEYQFEVRLDQSIDQDLTFDFATVSDTAVAEEDFVAADGSGSIPAGEATAVISVDVNGERIAEPTEHFFLDLSNVQAGGRVIDFDPGQIVNPDITSLGSFTFGALDLQVIGDIAYVTPNGRFRIADVSDPANIIQLADFRTGGNTIGVQVVGDVAYVAEQASGLAAQDEVGLRLLNVADPSNIVELGNFPTPTRTRDVHVVDNLAYLVEGEDGIRVVDVIDPANITEIGSFDTPGFAFDIQVVTDRAYVADASAGILILDVSNPGAISELGRFDTPGFALDVEVIGNVAYVADGSGGGLRLLDVTDPTNITELGSFDTNGSAEQVQIVGDLAYVADRGSDGGFRELNISNPANITERRSFGRAVHTLLVDGNRGYSNGFGFLEVLDLDQTIRATGTIVTDDPRLSLSEVSLIEGEQGTTIASFEVTLDVTITEDVTFDFATVSHTAIAGVDFVDVSGSGLIPAGQIGTAIEVEIIGDTSVEDDEQFFVDIFNIQSGDVAVGFRPNQIQPAGIFETNTYDALLGFAEAVEIVGDRAYVADFLLKVFTVLDISSPDRVFELAEFELPFERSYQSFQVVENRAYFASSLGLQVFDVSDPDAIFELATIGSFGVRSFQIVGDLAYVSDRTTQPNDARLLRVFDVSNLTDVIEISSLVIPSSFDILDIVDNRAYLSDEFTDRLGLVVLDISDPTNISELGTHSRRFRSIEVVGNIAFGLTNFEVVALDISDAANIVELGTYRRSRQDFSFSNLNVVGNRGYLTTLDNSFNFDVPVNNGLFVLDLTDPTNIRQLGYFAGLVASFPTEVEAVGDLAYVANGSGGFAS